MSHDIWVHVLPPASRGETITTIDAICWVKRPGPVTEPALYSGSVLFLPSQTEGFLNWRLAQQRALQIPVIYVRHTLQQWNRFFEDFSSKIIITNYAHLSFIARSPHFVYWYMLTANLMCGFAETAPTLQKRWILVVRLYWQGKRQLYQWQAVFHCRINSTVATPVSSGLEVICSTPRIE